MMSYFDCEHYYTDFDLKFSTAYKARMICTIKLAFGITMKSSELGENMSYEKKLSIYFICQDFVKNLGLLKNPDEEKLEVAEKVFGWQFNDTIKNVLFYLYMNYDKKTVSEMDFYCDEFLNYFKCCVITLLVNLNQTVKIKLEDVYNIMNEKSGGSEFKTKKEYVEKKICDMANSTMRYIPKRWDYSSECNFVLWNRSGVNNDNFALHDVLEMKVGDLLNEDGRKGVRLCKPLNMILAVDVLYKDCDYIELLTYLILNREVVVQNMKICPNLYAVSKLEGKNTILIIIEK